MHIQNSQCLVLAFRASCFTRVSSLGFTRLAGNDSGGRGISSSGLEAKKIQNHSSVSFLPSFSSKHKFRFKRNRKAKLDVVVFGWGGYYYYLCRCCCFSCPCYPRELYLTIHSFHHHLLIMTNTSNLNHFQVLL